MTATANTSNPDRAHETDLHMRVLVSDGAIALGCRGCGASRVIGVDRPARSIQYELTGWLGQHYDCAAGAAPVVKPQEPAGPQQPALAEVDLKERAKRSKAARKTFDSKLVDLFGVRPDDL